MGVETSGKRQTTQLGDGRPCPDDFVPRRWLRGAHRQTVVASFLPRENHLPEPERRLFQVDSEVQILTQCHWQPERGGRTALVIVHGLEGSSTSQYVIGTSNKAWDMGMNVVRMNVRNCGGSERLGPTLYHSGMSGDVGAIVKTLIEEDGLSTIALAGFSMGGNMVLKLAGEWGTNAPKQVRAVTAICPAMDLAIIADALHEWQNRGYEYMFLLGLRRAFAKKLKMLPERYQSYPRFSIRTLREFDDKITARYCGFAGADDYYYRAASARVVSDIAVPTMILHALDDPFVRMSAETRAKILANPNIRYIETAHGGHCAYLADLVGYDGRYAERKLIEFVQEFTPPA